MYSQKKFIVSHAPFWHSGSRVSERNQHIMIAAIPAILFGFVQYGMPAVGVMAMAISTAMFWEYAFKKVAKQQDTIGDCSAAVIGMVFAMLLPATAPWWLVITGTFIAIVVGKEIFGGIGGNPFNPAVVAIAILTISWKSYLDFNGALVDYDLGFSMIYPLSALKNFGVSAVADISPVDLLMGKQTGGIGAAFGLGLLIGGIYLILRGFIRWEICLSFIVGVAITAAIFKSMGEPGQYAGPVFHLLTGYTLIGAFFLATEDSSSPVNFVPMLIYGAVGGIMTVTIRNIGSYVDGVIFAIMICNLINPLVDKLRPKALGKVGYNE
ncbi:RnfABCDGE type electron transport complex subunit D [Desulfobacterales bacterium HSG16]|nr:RnfABCDGE type electron transport complex subunit D [Desulfobacterales bacterium HSG16]